MIRTCKLHWLFNLTMPSRMPIDNSSNIYVLGVDTGHWCSICRDDTSVNVTASGEWLCDHVLSVSRQYQVLTHNATHCLIPIKSPPMLSAQRSLPPSLSPEHTLHHCRALPGELRPVTNMPWGYNKSVITTLTRWANCKMNKINKYPATLNIY